MSSSTVDTHDIENRLWGSADELRANSGLKESVYSVPMLGLIFLKYADSRFAAIAKKLAEWEYVRSPANSSTRPGDLAAVRQPCRASISRGRGCGGRPLQAELQGRHRQFGCATPRGRPVARPRLRPVRCRTGPATRPLYR